MYYSIENEEKEWRGGVYLCTADSTLEVDILESKLRGEGIPCVKRHKGAGNFLEIYMGVSTAYPIDIYVPENRLDDAKNIIVAIPLDECDPVDFED